MFTYSQQNAPSFDLMEDISFMFYPANVGHARKGAGITIQNKAMINSGWRGGWFPPFMKDFSLTY